MKNVLLLALLITSCQPDYGELQPEYEKLVEVKGHLNQTQEEQIKQRAEIKKLEKQLDELRRQIDTAEAIIK